MKHLSCGAKSVLAIVAIMLSPVALVFAFPLAVGLGLDVFAMPAGRLVVFALWGVVGVILLRRLMRHWRPAATLADPADAGPRATPA